MVGGSNLSAKLRGFVSEAAPELMVIDTTASPYAVWDTPTQSVSPAFAAASVEHGGVHCPYRHHDLRHVCQQLITQIPRRVFYVIMLCHCLQAIRCSLMLAVALHNVTRLQWQPVLGFCSAFHSRGSFICLVFPLVIGHTGFAFDGCTGEAAGRAGSDGVSTQAVVLF